MIPFLGTALGAACVLGVQSRLGTSVQRIFTGFAAGVMVAASVWSLLIPALELSEGLGRLMFLPAVAGFWQLHCIIFQKEWLSALSTPVL